MSQQRQSNLFATLKMPELDAKVREANSDIVKKAGKAKAGAKTLTVRGQLAQQNKFAQKVLGVIEKAKQMLVDDGTKELVMADNEKRFVEYVDKMIASPDPCGFDTETTGLDPIDDHVVGYCFYVKGEKGIYVPTRHTDISGKILVNQMPEEVIIRELNRIIDAQVRLVYHHGKFDIRSTRNTIGVKPTIFWDTQVASNFLNENEPHKLKYLHDKYVLKKTEEDKQASSFKDLFEKIPANFIPPEVMYIYAADDPIKTFELYEYQIQFLTEDPQTEMAINANLVEATRLLVGTEIPLIPILADMEDEGITIDDVKAGELKEDRGKILSLAEKRVHDFFKTLPIASLPPELRGKLSNPVNLNSPDQLAIVLYDVMKLKSVDKKKPRGTGEEIIDLLVLQAKTKDVKRFFSDLLEYRGMAKLLSTYIEKMPSIVKRDKTGRLHGSFNQYGAKTGRFSSSDPNLQNIPARDKDIRKMFIAKDGHVLVGADYSQQEPRVLAHLCWVLFKDGRLKQAYAEGKDLYAWMASIVYGVDYDDCKEKRPDGSLNPEGKKRRDSMKSVVLGLMYGRGVDAIAEQLDLSVDEAQKIIDMLFDQFPAIKKVEQYYQDMAREKGYIVTVWGRKRRLPDMQLDPYEVVGLDGSDVEETVADYYVHRMNEATSNKAKLRIKDEANAYGLKIIDNTRKISDAERQCLNSVIQGTAADITKRAMVMLGQNETLKKWLFQMVLTVHDEVIGQCPREIALQAGNLMEEVMISAAAEKITVPMKVDAEITERWYGEDITEKLKEEMAA